VDFQLKFLHEEAKNIRDDYADVKSRLQAQKRQTESEYRDFKRHCSPETDNVTLFCSEFVTGMTKLAAVFCKAHIMACIATVEIAERDILLVPNAVNPFFGSHPTFPPVYYYSFQEDKESFGRLFTKPGLEKTAADKHSKGL